MCRLRAAAFGDRRDSLSPHPHAVAQMVRGGMADRARQARRVGAVPGARTGAALRHGLADGWHRQLVTSGQLNLGDRQLIEIYCQHTLQISAQISNFWVLEALCSAAVT